MRQLVRAIAALFITSGVASSQTGIPSVVHGLHGDAISFSGDIGTYGELYSMSGRDSRRPSSTARLFFNPTLLFYDAMAVSFNVLLSTEGNSASAHHQINQINQLGIRPQWAWGYANAGDFSEFYTPYTLNGILTRGGSVSINPGLFQFSAIGGYTRRTGLTGGSGNLDRYMYGGRIGVGNSQSFFDIVFLRVRDTPSRFQAVRPDSVVPPDSTQVGTSTASYQDSPQENIVFGMVTSFGLFEGIIDVHAEANASAFTRDMTSSEINQKKVPSVVRGLYRARLSTSADYVYDLKMNLNLSPLVFRMGYRYVGPGYSSLGVASLITDQREMLLGTRFHLSRWSFTFDWTRQNDNLLDQKLHTTIRQTYGGTMSVRPLDVWSMTILGNLLTMRNYAYTDTAAFIRYLILNLGTTHAITFRHGGLLQNGSVSYMYQKSADGNPLRMNNRFASHTATVNGAMELSDAWWMVPSVCLVASRAGIQSWQTVETFSITPRYRAVNGRLMTSLTLGLSRMGSASSLQLNLNANFRLTPSNTITLSIRSTGFSSQDPSNRAYTEQTASLTMSQGL
jgi:hypothetical protein